MCCRYYYDQLKVNRILEELRVRQPHSGSFVPGISAQESLYGISAQDSLPGISAQESLYGISAQESLPGGIITPGSRSIVITGAQSRIQPTVATWGFPGKGGQLVINARSESALQKSMFCNALETRRCLLPAECFYEWDAEKNKVTFSALDAPIIYLAGLWSLYDDLIRFVVLTTAANASMLPVHDRMPLMVGAPDVERWLFDTAFALAFLKSEMPLLRAEREFEQLSLF